MPRRSAADTARTHATIVDRAVHVASTDGLEGLTIGRLAGDLSMSKAGVIGHFGTKEELQLEALAEATARWRREVWGPVAGEEPGLPRLRAVARRWSEFLGDCPFPGGCFLTSASFEFDVFGRCLANVRPDGTAARATYDRLGLWTPAEQPLPKATAILKGRQPVLSAGAKRRSPCSRE